MIIMIITFKIFPQLYNQGEKKVERWKMINLKRGANIVFKAQA